MGRNANWDDLDDLSAGTERVLEGLRAMLMQEISSLWGMVHNLTDVLEALEERIENLERRER